MLLTAIVVAVLLAAGTALATVIEGARGENTASRTSAADTTKGNDGNYRRDRGDGAKKEVAYSTATSSPGEIIPTSSEYPAGTEVGGIQVEEFDSNGNVTATYSETWVAGEPDQYTKADELRAGSEISPEHTLNNGGRRVSCYKPAYRAGALVYRFYVRKHWHWWGGKVHYPNTWADGWHIYDHVTNYRGVVRKGSGYDNRGYWHWSSRKGHYYHEPFSAGGISFPARHSYPWVKIWVNARGGYDCSVGEG